MIPAQPMIKGAKKITDPNHGPAFFPTAVEFDMIGNGVLTSLAGDLDQIGIFLEIEKGLLTLGLDFEFTHDGPGHRFKDRKFIIITGGPDMAENFLPDLVLAADRFDDLDFGSVVGHFFASDEHGFYIGDVAGLVKYNNYTRALHLKRTFFLSQTPMKWELVFLESA